MKEERVSVFNEILKKNNWLAKKICEKTKISSMTIYRISKTWIWNDENKILILNLLISENYIREWEYTITEFFTV